MRAAEKSAALCCIGLFFNIISINKKAGTVSVGFVVGGDGFEPPKA